MTQQDERDKKPMEPPAPPEVPAEKHEQGHRIGDSGHKSASYKSPSPPTPANRNQVR